MLEHSMQYDPLLPDQELPDAHMNAMRFTQHGTSVQPISPEDDIRSAAQNVVPSVPLGEVQKAPAAHSEDTTPSFDPNTRDLSSLSAEDIPEEFSF